MSPNSSQLTFQESNLVSTPRNASPSLAVDGDELSQTSADSIDSCCSDASGRLSAENIDRAYSQLAESLFLQSLLQRSADKGISKSDANLDSDAKVPSMDLSANTQLPEMGAEVSKANIQNICRRRAPVSFSLSQEGCTLASVWLPKRTFQLGDMVAGRVDIHHAGLIRVYQISIWLESIELVGNQFANYEPAQTEELTRKVFAEHHGFCRGNSTVGFSLATSPSAASSFESQLVSNVWQLRIELIISFDKSTGFDMALSAATPFPPSQNHQAKSPNLNISTTLPSSSDHSSYGFGNAQDREAASVSSLASAPTSPSLSSPPPVMPLFGSAQQSKSGLRSGRLRSSTVVGNYMHHQLPTPRIVSRSADMPMESLGKMDSDANARLLPLSGGFSRYSFDYQQLPSAHRSSIDNNPQTVRRRFDVASQVKTQTLSCTVPIQMHPSLNRTHADGQKDSYTVDLTKRS
ncbi:Golgi membrane exchange factor (Ric1p-Rgp1p) subunit [Coemansia erecta]|nr:Golgi membrane exchange factor (Ric1p-Rgp1p) subunit [Coemansia erecta]